MTLSTPPGYNEPAHEIGEEIKDLRSMADHLESLSEDVAALETFQAEVMRLVDRAEHELGKLAPHYSTHSGEMKEILENLIFEIGDL